MHSRLAQWCPIRYYVRGAYLFCEDTWAELSFTQTHEDKYKCNFIRLSFCKDVEIINVSILFYDFMSHKKLKMYNMNKKFFVSYPFYHVCTIYCYCYNNIVMLCNSVAEGESTGERFSPAISRTAFLV